MFWSKHIAATMAKCHESVSKKVEKTGHFDLGVPRRHTFDWTQPTGGAKKFANHAARPRPGMVVNQKKSQLVPTQQVEHLGFMGDLKQGLLQVPQEKMKNIRKELGKLLTHTEMSCRKMAAILGATRSFLMAMPFLRAFTDQLVQFVNQQEQIGWDRKVQVPSALKAQVKEMGILMDQWKGRTFQGKTPPRELHSDSS